MNKALFLTPHESFLIFAKDISSRKEYLEKFIGKLQCPTQGCNAQLDYVEIPYSGHEKIFRTHKGSEHSLDCPYCIMHQNTNAPSFSSETFSQAISEDHIKSILKGLYQRNINPEPKNYNTPKHGLTKHRTDNAEPPARHSVASIDPHAEPVARGEREPSVRKRRSQDLLIEDNNSLRGIDGKIDSATIGADYVELHFSSSDMPVSLLFYNAFRDESEYAYQLVNQLAHLLNTTDLNILVCCLGIVEIKNGKATIQIMSPSYITIEGLSIYNYMSLYLS